MKRLATSLLLAGVLAFSVAGEAQAPLQPIQRTMVTAGATATYTFYCNPPAGYWHTRISIGVTDDGDGGDANYTVQHCSLAPAACYDFTPAVSGTVTVGGTATASVVLNEPFSSTKIAITGNDALVTVGCEIIP